MAGAGSKLEHLKRLAEQLSAEDQLELVEHVAKNLREKQGAERTIPEGTRTPRDLYGIWRDRFPPDADLDALLHEIRHEWEAEWPEVFKP